MNIYIKRLRRPAMEIEKKAIPVPTLRRYPVYCSYLKESLAKKVGYISATAIAVDLNLIPIQVRKDIEMTGLTGKPKIGYNVEELIDAIEHMLGWNSITCAIVAGMGNLGSALFGYQGFKNYGLEIVAGFDTDKKKQGKEIVGHRVYAPEKMKEIVDGNNARIGIITVPAKFAQEAADIMVRAGIKAIWNFAPVTLNVPDDVLVQQENLASSLAVLSQRIKISGKLL
jgi:redox-sensing transcriptional repressor